MTTQLHCKSHEEHSSGVTINIFGDSPQAEDDKSGQILRLLGALMLKVSELDGKLGEIEALLTEGFTELTSEIANLRAELADVAIPASAEESLVRVTGLATRLANVIVQEPPVEEPPVDPVDELPVEEVPPEDVPPEEPPAVA